jgi:hypothetical protein
VPESSNNPNLKFVIAPPEAPSQGGAPALESSNPDPDKKNTLRNRLIGAGVILVLGVTGSIIGVNASKNGEKPAEATSSSAPAHPSEAPTSNPEGQLDVKVIPKDVVEYNLFETLTPSQQAEIKKMDDMSLSEFRALPYEEQFKFARFVYDNNIDVLKYRLDNNNDSDAYKSANLDTPEGILTDSLLETSLMSSLKTLDPKKGVGFDTLTAKKTLSIGGPALIADPVYLENSDKEIDTFNSNTPVTIFDITIEKSIVKKDGDIVMNTVNEKSGDISQSTVHIAEYTDIQGKKVKGEFTTLSVNDSDPRFIHNLVN